MLMFIWDRRLLKRGTPLTRHGPPQTRQFNCYPVGGRPKTEFRYRPIDGFISAGGGACRFLGLPGLPAGDAMVLLFIVPSCVFLLQDRLS